MGGISKVFDWLLSLFGVATVSIASELKKIEDAQAAQAVVLSGLVSNVAALSTTENQILAETKKANETLDKIVAFLGMKDIVGVVAEHSSPTTH